MRVCVWPARWSTGSHVHLPVQRYRVRFRPFQIVGSIHLHYKFKWFKFGWVKIYTAHLDEIFIIGNNTQKPGKDILYFIIWTTVSAFSGWGRYKTKSVKRFSTGGLPLKKNVSTCWRAIGRPLGTPRWRVAMFFISDEGNFSSLSLVLTHRHSVHIITPSKFVLLEHEIAVSLHSEIVFFLKDGSTDTDIWDWKCHQIIVGGFFLERAVFYTNVPDEVTVILTSSNCIFCRF